MRNAVPAIKNSHADLAQSQAKMAPTSHQKDDEKSRKRSVRKKLEEGKKQPTRPDPETEAKRKRTQHEDPKVQICCTCAVKQRIFQKAEKKT